MWHATYLLIPALAATAAKAQAAPMNEISLYSVESCGGDPNDLDILTTTLTIYPNSDPDVKSSECMATWIDLPDWPRSDGGQGRYNAWVKGSDIEKGCYLWFYNYWGPEEEAKPDAACVKPYRRVENKQPCADLELTANFGYAYCCGNCSDETQPDRWPKREILAEGDVDSTTSLSSDGASNGKRDVTKDVTAIKRAPLLDRVGKRDNKCRWVKDDDDTYTTYGPATRASNSGDCPLDQTSCGDEWHWESSMAITNGWNIQASVGVEFFEAVSVELSAGYEHSETQEESISLTKSLAPEPGHNGFATFAPLLKCGRGHTEGDCSEYELDKLGDEPWCINVLFGKKNEPRGEWSMVTVD